MCVPEPRCFQIRFFSLIWPWPFIKLGHRPACCSMDVYTFLQSLQMGREQHHANMSFSTSLQFDQANKTVNSGNLNRLSSSFIWWWCISLVIDNLVSLVCTPVCVCVCVCSNEANTPTCRQTPHHNTHTQTHTQCRKMRTIVIFVGINTPLFITVFFNSSSSSSSSSSFQILRLTHATFPCSHGETNIKLLFFQSHLQQKWIHQECFHANTNNNVALSLLVTKETKLSSNVGHGCGIWVLTWLLCEQWTIAKKKKKTTFRTESWLFKTEWTYSNY